MCVNTLEWKLPFELVLHTRSDTAVTVDIDFLLSLFIKQKYPDRFTFHPTHWKKFPDGTDSIEIGGFTPRNLISGEHVLFLASFHNNDVTLSQFQVMICLLQSFIESLTVVLPYSPVGKLYHSRKLLLVWYLGAF